MARLRRHRPEKFREDDPTDPVDIMATFNAAVSDAMDRHGLTRAEVIRRLADRLRRDSGGGSADGLPPTTTEDHDRA